jgi:hypothetical protein
MAREQWSIDGYEITNGWLYDIEVREGLGATPAPVGDNSVVAGRTGELWTPKSLGAGGFVLSMWLGAATRSELDARYDEFVRLFMRTKSLRTVVRTMADGSQRTCKAEVVSGLVPVPIGSTGMRLSVEFRVPSGLWLATGNTTLTATAGSALVGSPKILTLSGALAKSTGPMEDLIYTITGPIQNARIEDITDGVTGDFLYYATTIAAAQTLIVNASTWALTGTGGHTVVDGALQHSGSRFLAPGPAQPGSSPRVQMYGTGGMSAATNLSVTGPASFLA